MDAYDHIEEYLSGNLSGEKLEDFEAAMRNDAEFKSVVENYDQIHTVSDGLLEGELLDEVEGVSRSLDSQEHKGEDAKWNDRSKVSIWRWVLIGIAILTALLFIYNKLDSANEKLSPALYIAESYRPPLWPAARGESDNDFAALGIQAFENGEKELGMSYLIDSLDQKMLGRYWLSELNLKYGNYREALDYVPTFEKTDLHYHRANYVKVLALVGIGDIEEVSKVLPLLTTEYKSLLPPLDELEKDE